MQQSVVSLARMLGSPALRGASHANKLFCLPWSLQAGRQFSAAGAGPGPNSSTGPAASPADATSSSNNNESSAAHGQPQPPHADSAKPFSIAAHMTDANTKEPLKSAEYASSFDDKYGVQKNWFNALYKQINYLAKTGTAPQLKGRQREVFEAVEREFEGLYNRWIKGKNLEEQAHRSMLMCCLSVATYRILNDELGDTKAVRDLIRINLGGVMLSILKPLHQARLWVLRWILREDMYNQAVSFLPALTQDMGALCTADVEQGPNETYMSVSKCGFHEMLSREDAPFLLTEFCCHHNLMWMHEFRRHGVAVSLDQCMAWDDGCCKLRVGRNVKGSTESASSGQEKTA